MRLGGLLMLSFWSAAMEMRRKKMRTILGISMLTIGTVSVVLSVGLVQGIVQATSEYIRVTGGLELMRIYETGLVQMNPDRQFWRPLSTVDAERLRLRVGEKAMIAPEVGFPPLPVGRPGKEPISTYVVGGTPEYFTVNRSDVDQGRYIDIGDCASRNRVIVISPEVRARLFSQGENPLGQVVTFMGADFRVVGVMKEYDFYTGPVKKGIQFKNRFSVIPLSLAQEMGYGATDQVSGIHVGLKQYSDLGWARDKIVSTLLAARAGIRDIELDTREREAEGWHSTERAATMAAFLLAMVALLVAGLSTTVLMLASLAERVKEIGIRRACGAGSGDIAFQFMVESFTMGIIGGVLGIILGYLLVPAVGRFMPNTLPGRPIFLPSVAMAGASFSVLVGLLAGILPAVRAGRLPPLDAIRNP
jgi:putative ABC transport system permease protein